MIPHTEPPPYSTNSTGFPPGYFIIRNLATRKLLDVAGRKIDDGSELILYPENESSIVLSFRDPFADNQVFFVDYLGNLCSKHSGHGVDVEADGRLVLRHRRPMTSTFPNHSSHPLPQFNYSPKTGFITLSFVYDPAYPNTAHVEPSSSSSSSSTTWRNRNYILTAIPLPRPRNLFDDAADFFVGAASTLTSPLSNVFLTKPPFEASTTMGDVQREGFELRDEEVSEVDRVEDTPDDSPDPIRRVRVIALSTNTTDNGTNVTAESLKRRQWEIVPLLNHKALTGAL